MSRLARPTRLDLGNVDAWIGTHPGWEVVDGSKIACTFTFPDFASALGFVVRIGLAAERRDHHPDIELAWGRVRIAWSTHDAGGISVLDLELAETTAHLYR